MIDRIRSLLPVFLSLLILVMVSFSIALNSFEKGQFTCNRYILNTYLYIILTFNIIAVQCLSLEYNNVNYVLNLWQHLAVLLILIGVIIILRFVSAKNVITKHLAWLLLIILLGFVFYPLYNFTEDKNIILSAALTTILITVILSAVAFLKPESISFSLGPILLFMLIAVIIMEVSLLIIYRNDYSSITNILRGVSYLVIFIFVGFILYDTKMLQIRAKQCKNNADYINESLHIFLDMFNIFVRLIGLGR